MKKSVFLFCIILFCISCKNEKSPKQYFEESPEIDVCKKAVDAYLNQDWVTYRSLFSDTAKIWHNKYFTKYPPKDISEIIETAKDPLASMEFYTYEDDLWEMIVGSNGQNWVYFWANWKGKLNENSEEIEMPVHIAYSVSDGKIVEEVGFWDNLPFYLAMQKLEASKTKN